MLIATRALYRPYSRTKVQLGVRLVKHLALIMVCAVPSCRSSDLRDLMRYLYHLISFLLGPTAPVGWAPVVARLALGAVFVPTGLGKFLNHDGYVERFDRWGFPESGTVAYVVGTIEIVFGLLVLLGIAPRLAGLTLAGNMVGAFFTAGLVDGGQDLWLPPIMFALAATVLVRGGGRWQLPNLAGSGRGAPAGSARLSG